MNAADLLITNARVIDGRGSPPRERLTLLIRDGRLHEITTDRIEVEGIPVLDAAGATVLPGLIDSHVHFIAAPGGAYRKDSPETRRELTRQHLRAYLACGVTTVLDAGIDPASAREIKEWLGRGHPGPRFLTTGPYIRPPGGYGWDGFGSESTVEEVNAKLDVLQTLGAAGVKLAFEDGRAAFSAELRQAIIEGARRRKLPLYVHATTETTQHEALAWGAHAIMHGLFGGVWVGQSPATRSLGRLRA